MRIIDIFNASETPGQKIRASDRVLRKFIEYGVYGLIILSPLPIASVEKWSILAIQLTVLAMGIAYFLLSKRPEINPILAGSLKWPKRLSAGFFLLIALQLVPLPVFLVKVVSPSTFRFYQENAFNMTRVKFLPLSVAPSQTFLEGMEMFAYFLLAFILIKTVISRVQIKRIFVLLLILGFFEAIYGMLELTSQNPSVLFYKKTINLGAVTGTFINPNHLAGYLVMIFPLAIGFVFSQINFSTLARGSIREKILYFSEKKFVINFLVMAAAVVISLGILLTRSRMGFFLVLFSLLLFFQLGLVYFGRMNYSRKVVKRFFQVVFLLITLIFFYVGMDATLERFSIENISQGGRAHFWGDILTVVGDFPLLGTGLGTFSSVYPAYSDEILYGKLVHAHNDYLEYLSELGIIGMALLFGLIVFLLTLSFRAWKQRKNPNVKGLVLGCLVSIFAIGVHSLVDFNLHIPANMLLFTLILSLTVVVSHYKWETRKKKSENSE